MKRRHGFTLIELLVTIIVIGISATALLSLFSSLVRGSADPVIQQQAVSIAEAYLEEISLRPIADPNGGEAGGNEGETRPNYDDIWDYNLIVNSAVLDQNNQPVPGLGDYQVTVNVVQFSLNGIPVGAFPDPNSAQINVTVTHPAIDNVVLTGYRTNY